MNNASCQAKEVFLNALDCTSSDQLTHYLDEACNGDAALRGRVEELLQAQRQAGSFLGGRWTAATEEIAPAESAGTIIGPYKLLQQIGEGGMGVVFMAEQSRPVERKVALKIIKAGMDTRQVIARFEAEQQALALMEHQNIAKVLDAGSTASGQAYFAMELVRGVAITQYCDEHQLAPRERLSLFLPLCRAVAHAHQKGIIHRDLKPSNVLVAEYDHEPVAKIIDFGVAKAIGQRLTEKTMFTEFGQVVGTFEYMSPEQAKINQLDIDTRSDIYSLGVLLYELLTGSTPFERKRFREAAFDQVLQIIREEEPPRPSARLSTLAANFATTAAEHRRTDPRQLSQTLRGDLDWIVMKCLEKDRNRRYDSANALAADIERYLADEAVEACPPSTLYRFRKLARRNKAALAMATVMAVGVLVAVAALAVSRNLIADKAKQLETNNYDTRIALAERELAAGNVGRAEELLDECPNNQRGWEWHFLKRQRYGNSPPMRQTTTVVRAAFSPDGRQLAISLIDGTLSICDPRTGEALRTLERQAGVIGDALPQDLAYSRDGRYLAAARNDGKVRVWEPDRGQLLYTLEAHKGPAFKVAFSPDSRTLASGGADRSVRLWDLASGQLLKQFSQHPTAVKGVAFRPDGQSLVAACDDGTVKVWDRQSGRETFSFRGEGLTYASSAFFTADARRLAWSCLDGFIKVWETTTGRLEINHQCNTHQCRAVAFSPDGERIAAAGFDGTVRILNAATGREMLTIFGHNSPVAGITFSPDGFRLASSSYDQTVRLWDASPLMSDPLVPHCITLTGHTNKISDVVFSPNGHWLASASYDDTIKLWELSAVSPATGSTEIAGDLLATGAITLRQTLLEHHGIVRGLAFSPDSRTLASASWDKTLKIWDLKDTPKSSVTEMRSVPFPERLNSIAFSRDGKFVAVGQERGIALFDPATGKSVHPFKRTPAPVPGLVFHPNRPLLISTGASDPAIKVWDIDAGNFSFEIRHNFHPHPGVAVSPDGKRIASPGVDMASGDHTVKIWNVDWDAKSYTEFRTLKGHRGYVWKAAFSPDGRYLASGSWDSTVKVWDLAAPESQEPVTLRGSAGFVESLAFRPDGRRLAAGSGYTGHGEIMVWDAVLWNNPRVDGPVAINMPPK